MTRNDWDSDLSFFFFFLLGLGRNLVGICSDSYHSARIRSECVGEGKVLYFSGSPFSHFGFWTFGAAGVDTGVGTEEGAEIFSGFCMSGKSVSESCIFDKILKRLQVDSEGVLFTHCLVQNPPPVQLFLPAPTAAPLSVVSLS